MGFTFRKSFRLPGGFRVNLSKSGIGVSAGVPGFRVGVGPGGGRVSAGIPGTGLGWTSKFGLGGGSSESAARAAHQKLVAGAPPPDRAAERERNAHEVAVHESTVARLTQLHRGAWRPWDWTAVAATPPPGAPPAGADPRVQQEALLAYQRWQWFNGVARGILAGDVAACQAALDHLGPFAELHELGAALSVAATAPWCVEAWLTASPLDAVPAEDLSLTPTGKLSRKKLSPTRRWDIYQDHVASAAFRVAREVFGLLPIPVVLVHVATPRLDTRTGQQAMIPILSVAFDRETFGRLNLDAIDPSDALAGFEHNMVFKKTTGFAPVSVLERSEFEVVEG